MMIRRVLASFVSLLLAAPVLADDVSEFDAAFGKAVSGAVQAEAYMSACDRHDPASGASRRDAMAGWAHRVDLAGYKRLLRAAGEKIPGLLKSIEDQSGPARKQIDAAVAADASICSDFRNQLRQDAYDIARPVRHALRYAKDFGIAVAAETADPASAEVEVVPLVVLSARLAGKMDEIGSSAGARDDRDLRNAREEHALAWLKQWPATALYGRVTGKSEMREWRDDQQSRFSARCLSFADDAQEANMEREIGQQRILVGEVRWVRDEAESGVLGLRDCRLFVHDAAKTELASIDDDSAGLMLRPLEFEEAFAGPGKGISVGDIDRVLYDAEFENRLDGFGNGYTSRQEDIYVLLRDGTAYRHEWNFAFTDLDTARSRAREPGRWFTWRKSWGSIKLKAEDGEEIDLSKARRLMSVPEGQRLDQTYYFLNVGMGGSRSDREYAFKADGQVVHRRGGFVAGNFGTHYITVVGKDDVTTSKYAFDGYTLLIDGPDGQERHLAAVFEGDDPARPEEIIIDGQVHWLKE